jgi:hypothetical protein
MCSSFNARTRARSRAALTRKVGTVFRRRVSAQPFYIRTEPTRPPRRVRDAIGLNAISTGPRTRFGCARRSPIAQPHARPNATPIAAGRHGPPEAASTCPKVPGTTRRSLPRHPAVLQGTKLRSRRRGTLPPAAMLSPVFAKRVTHTADRRRDADCEGAPTGYSCRIAFRPDFA